jgi:pyridoxine/pyridoxamine 5'-phosphate oxidase
VLAFPRRHDLAALATVDDERAVPACAIVGIAPTERMELVFGTARTNHAFRHLQTNPHGALKIGWRSATGSMRYECEAEEISASSPDW